MGVAVICEVKLLMQSMNVSPEIPDTTAPRARRIGYGFMNTVVRVLPPGGSPARGRTFW
jgi:hypothetical protein